MKIIQILILLVSIGLMSGCTKLSDEDYRAAKQAIERGAMLIDVRSMKEYNEKHIEGSVNIPIDLLDKMYDRLPRDKELVVYCRTGSRSAVAAHLLRAQGWTVYDIVNQDEWERVRKP